jgi:Zn-dependent protease
MPVRTFEFKKPKRFENLTRVARIRGVDVRVHWTLLLVSAFILLNAITRPVLSIVGLLSYFGVLLLHETGHLIAAHRRGSHVHEILIYPVHGRCVFDQPWSKFDHCVIAWGGVIAQLVVAIPLIFYIAVFGYTTSDAANAFLAIFGGLSPVIAIYNLIPAANLDGATAWAIIPEYLRRRRLYAVKRR